MLSVLALLSVSDAVPSSQHESSVLPEHLNAVSRQAECDGVGPLPEFLQLNRIPGIKSNCVKLGDVLTLPGSLSEYGVANSANSDSQAVDIMRSIIDPTQASIKATLQMLTDRANNNICFGNFEGGELKAKMDIDQDPMLFNKCKELPVLKGSEWSVFAFAITTPFPGCLTAGNGTAAFCAAVSICPDTGLPSVAVAINAIALECLGQNMVALDGGITAGLTKVASYGLDFITFGFSLSNSLVTKAYVYTGQEPRKYKFITYEIHGIYQDSIRLKLKLEKFKLPKVIDLSGGQKRIISVKGIENVKFENTVKSFVPGTDSEGWDTDMLDLLDSITDVTIQAALIIELKMKFKFSAVKALQKILPNSNSMTLGQMNMFFTTGAVTPPGDEYTDMVLKPGIYAFIGSNAVPAVLKGLLEYTLQFVGSILDLFDWIPFKIDSKDLLKNFDVGASDNFAFGFTANTDHTALVLNVPLLFDFLGYVTIECKTDYSSLKCSVSGEFNTKFFEAIGEAIAEGVLWIIKETDEFFNDIGNTIGAAFEDAFEGTVSAFSEENLKATAKLIEKGALSIGTDIKDELENWAKWCDTAFNDFGDSIADLATDAIHEISGFGKGIVDDAEDAFNNLGKELEKAADFLGKQFSCPGDGVILSIAGCNDCCLPMNDAVNALRRAGNKIERALNDIINELSNIANDVAEVFYKERSSFSYSKTNDKDEYGCDILLVKKTVKKYFLGIKVSETTRTVGTTSDEECVKAALENAKEVIGKYNATEVAEEAFQATYSQHKDAMFGASITKEDLLSSADFKCSRELERDQMVSGTNFMPVSVTCSAKSIGSDGTFSGPVVTISQTKTIDMSNATSRGQAISILWNDVKSELAEKITPTIVRRR
ncbi:hypothetical protein NDN08_001004 [Rhodosorus marinus]|uniref:Uncharacterized protein n=1 Tax=Rhodosorus marinus TaxID=101924 RepID=A0AAV8USK5_9RHOD|nr:hypothetical protein NDN08_001004 [Rhodosorus marinus]